MRIVQVKRAMALAGLVGLSAACADDDSTRGGDGGESSGGESSSGGRASGGRASGGRASGGRASGGEPSGGSSSGGASMGGSPDGGEPPGGTSSGGASGGGSPDGGEPAAGGRSTGGAPSTGGASSGGGSSGGSSSGGSSSGGAGGDPPTLDGCSVFPADSAWNRDVSGLPVHPNSDAFIATVGRDTTLHPDFGTEWEGAPIGIPYVLVGASQAEVEIVYDAYGDESDPGPMPIPLDAPIEGVGPADAGGDRHVIAIDTDACMLYELYRAFPSDGGWRADSGAVWDLSIDDAHPEGCTSADAAGLPIFPGLVRYDEVVEMGEIPHAIRFTVSTSQRAYVAPATHYASDVTDPDAPPMGLRFRMKADYDCSGYSSEVQVICAAMKRYGLIVADNGSDWYLSGAPDPRWSDDNLRDLGEIPGSAFEVVDTGDAFVTDAPNCSL